MIGINQENDIALSNLLAKRCSVLRTGGRVDENSGDIFRRAYAWWYRNLGQNGLDFVADELVFD